MAPPKRRLEDLYILGREVTFKVPIDPASEDASATETEEISVWLQKLNPLESAQALRRAQAARARVLSIRSDKESDEYMAMRLEVIELGDEDALVNYLLSETTVRADEVSEAKLAAEDEWAKDDYLQGLRDAWEETLSTVYAEDPEDPEALRVFKELKRFTDIAQAAAKDEVDDKRSELEGYTIENLQEQAMKRVLQYHADIEWLNEFRRSELWLGVREIDSHKARYFAKREDVDQLSGEVLTRLLSETQELTVDISEGKDSEATPNSSPSPEQPSKEEMPISSGLLTAVQ